MKTRKVRILASKPPRSSIYNLPESFIGTVVEVKYEHKDGLLVFAPGLDYPLSEVFLYPGEYEEISAG